MSNKIRDDVAEDPWAELRGPAPDPDEATGYRLVCPGVDEYGHGLTAKTIHMAGCCDRFSALAAEEQKRQGLRIPNAYIVEALAVELADVDDDGM